MLPLAFYVAARSDVLLCVGLLLLQQDRCVVVQLDVTDKASIQSAVQTVKSSLGDGAVLQGLVNNAGTGTKGGSFGW